MSFRLIFKTRLNPDFTVYELYSAQLRRYSDVLQSSIDVVLITLLCVPVLSSSSRPERSVPGTSMCVHPGLHAYGASISNNEQNNGSY